MSDDVIVNGDGKELPGHRILHRTDLEIAYNLRGDNLVLRVNKSGVQIFRVMLEAAATEMSSDALFDFNGASPDFVFKVGDTKARMLRLAKSAGLDDDQLARLEAKRGTMSVS
jgi:hypothetical protein